MRKHLKQKQFTAYIEQDEDGVYIGTIPSLPSCYAQGETQQKMLENLSEVIQLCLRNTDAVDEVEKHRFVGIQNLDLSHA